MTRAACELRNLCKSTFVYRLLHPRRTHLYCVGTAKSGTHSIAAIWGDRLKCAHEFESEKLIDIILDHSAGRITDKALGTYLLKRDHKSWLEVDSSQLNFFILDQLVELFPESKFILTIRNPYPWLDSFINHQLARGGSGKWIKLRDLRFRPDVYSHNASEQVLKENNLYTLDGYLSYWANHNKTVIETVPAGRLLIVRTDRITQSVKEIASFAGVPQQSLNGGNSHAFPAKKAFNMLDKIDPEYLENKVRQHCGELITQFFPELRSGRHFSQSSSRSAAAG